MTHAVPDEASVTISSRAYRTISECALRALPDECCGVLAGHGGTDAEILEAWELRNRAESNRPRRFAMDPADLYAHTVRARRLQLDVLGFFHSHPEGDAVPSASDVREGSGWPGYVNAIFACAPGGGPGSLRFYRTHHAYWREIPSKGVNP